MLVTFRVEYCTVYEVVLEKYLETTVGIKCSSQIEESLHLVGLEHRASGLTRQWHPDCRIQETQLDYPVICHRMAGRGSSWKHLQTENNSFSDMARV